MRGIQFVIDDTGRKVAVLLDLKRPGPVVEDLVDGLVSESRRDEKSIPYERYRAERLKRACIPASAGRAMRGIQYVTDEKGHRVAVQIDLKKHRELWENIEDLRISRSRRHSKRIPLEKVKARLIKNEKLALA
jgi:hypothetical protein